VAHRIFTDRRGRVWDVWEVRPTVTEWLSPVARELRNGWLAFETANERRRFAPPPEGWTGLSDGYLGELLDAATTLPRRPRLIE
jgi:hypothetical protein